MHTDISQKTETPEELSGSESLEAVTVHSLSLMMQVPGMVFQSEKWWDTHAELYGASRRKSNQDIEISN